MKYRDSQVDVRLRRWFQSSLDQQLLRGIELNSGTLRGMTNFKINIEYPLLAIAGRNGAGKSTILAMAACAFHNRKKDLILKNRKKSYYTFADFFIQHSEEVPPEGLSIHYKIAHNNWKKNESAPTGKGILYQERRKTIGGKWSNYDRRVSRPVIFLGIERIVPHIEKSQSRSYSKYFSETTDTGWESDVKDCVGYILNKSYEGFKYVYHSKYRLPLVQCNGRKISGFNMGAGENALFEIFFALYSCPDGSLIIVDEIELGLHAEAQVRLIKKLKDICLARKLQIIFTTHSEIVFGCIPDESRIFVETISGRTVITPGISPDYAFSKLISDNSEELDVLVEDIVAEKILASSLPSELRSRIKIEVVGSASALSRQLGAIYQRARKKPTLVIFDGDQKKLQDNNIKMARSMLEKNLVGFDEWFENSISYLPGEQWPEKWIIEKNFDYIEHLATIMRADINIVKEALIRGREAEKHKEFVDTSIPLGLGEIETLERCCLNLAIKCPGEFGYICEKIKNMLD
ncbi:putative AbiEii toxin of type IV toxin-antitoxin system [Rahnella aquatilis]|nr:putative AbiEii toxin of type IV toxin-antitoxin system [Rahnella aquatilis]